MFRNISRRKWLGETYDHDAFVLDTNGTLLTNRLLDFEAMSKTRPIQIIASTGTKQSVPAGIYRKLLPM